MRFTDEEMEVGDDGEGAGDARTDHVQMSQETIHHHHHDHERYDQVQYEKEQKW